MDHELQENKNPENKNKNVKMKTERKRHRKSKSPEPEGVSLKRSERVKTFRENEKAEFYELAKLLPLPSHVAAQLNRESVLRLTISYLRMRQMFPDGLGEEWGAAIPENRIEKICSKELGTFLSQSLDGFIFIVGGDGKINYLSENLSDHLGLTQLKLIGTTIYDYIHQDDEDEMKSVLNPHYNPTNLPSENIMLNSNVFELKRAFFLRMRCAIRNRSAGLTTKGYKVIHCSGYLKVRQDSGSKTVALVAIGHSLPSPTFTEMELNSNMFMFRASLDLKLLYFDSRVTQLTGYERQELIENTLYHYIHVSDVDDMRLAHQTLISKGQVTTKYYRMLAKDGGWVWVQSYATIVNNRGLSRPHYIISVNFVLSGPEVKDVRLSGSNSSSVITDIGSEVTVEQNKPKEPQPPVITKKYSGSSGRLFNEFVSNNSEPYPLINSDGRNLQLVNMAPSILVLAKEYAYVSYPFGMPYAWLFTPDFSCSSSNESDQMLANEAGGGGYIPPVSMLMTSVGQDDQEPAVEFDGTAGPSTSKNFVRPWN